MTIKKTLIYFPLILIALLLFLPGSVVRASEIKMDKKSFSFDKSNTHEVIEFWALDDDIEFTKVKCSKPSVVKATVNNSDKGIIDVVPAGIGSCTITATDTNNDTATFTVTVNKAYYVARLKLWTELRHFGYGSKKAIIYSYPGTSGSLKIGKEKIKFKVNSKGKAKIKIKKLYKLNKKYTLTVRNTKHPGKPSYTEKRKLDSLTSFVSAHGYGKKIELRLYNLHKGDLVKIKFRGKSFKKRIKKNYSYKEIGVTFKVHKKVSKKKDYFSMQITNKFKQTLDKRKVDLYEGESDYEDDLDEE